MNRLLISNSGKYRLIRTIIQGIIGVLVANIDMIVGAFEFSPETKALIVALVMAILTRSCQQSARQKWTKSLFRTVISRT